VRAITFVHFTQGYKQRWLYQLRAPGIPSGLSSIFPYYKKGRCAPRRSARDKIRIKNVFLEKQRAHTGSENKLAFDANHERKKMYIMASVNVTQILKTNFWAAAPGAVQTFYCLLPE